MSRRKISQREAHATLKRLKALEQREAERAARYTTDWPGGTHVDDIDASTDSSLDTLKLARKLGFYVVAVPDNTKIKFFAVKP
jgi:hypothetical protein